MSVELFWRQIDHSFGVLRSFGYSLCHVLRRVLLKGIIMTRSVLFNVSGGESGDLSRNMVPGKDAKKNPRS